MTRKELEIFDTGVLGKEIPVSAAVKGGGFVFVGVAVVMCLANSSSLKVSYLPKLSKRFSICEMRWKLQAVQ